MPDPAFCSQYSGISPCCLPNSSPSHRVFGAPSQLPIAGGAGARPDHPINRPQAFKELQQTRPDFIQIWATTLRRSNFLLILAGMSRWQRRLGSSQTYGARRRFDAGAASVDIAERRQKRCDNCNHHGCGKDS
jgi:hypothetical protein